MKTDTIAFKALADGDSFYININGSARHFRKVCGMGLEYKGVDEETGRDLYGDSRIVRATDEVCLTALRATQKTKREQAWAKGEQ